MHETDNTKDVLAEPESPPQDVIEGFRLSAQQKEAWLRGGQDELTLQAMFEVGGPLDARRLEGALGQVVDRHEILRTRFQRLPGMEIPIQVISGAAACPFRFVEVGEDGAVFGPEEIERLREEELRALGSEGEANVRCLLIRRLPLRHVLILTVSALSADARSLDNLLGEVVHFYGNGSGAAEDEPLQYVEFS
ncbi:MAG: condensation domain-containing protein, partial [Acidobacteriota bacterium]